MHPPQYSDAGRASHQLGTHFTPQGASAYLLAQYGMRRSPAYLAKLRVVGGGPEFRKDGLRYVIYERPALDAYANAQISRPLRSTSEAA